MTPEREASIEDIAEVVDLEEFSKSGRPAPKAKKYLIKIDGVKYEVSQPTITGRQLLQLAGKPIDRFMIVQRLRGGHTKRIGLDEVVDLRAPGVERFMTLPLDQTEGA